MSTTSGGLLGEEPQAVNSTAADAVSDAKCLRCAMPPAQPSHELLPSGEQLDLISHFGGVMEMLHRFLAAGCTLCLVHQAHVLVLEVGKFLLHQLFLLRALKGFLFYRPKSSDRQELGHVWAHAFCLIPILVGSSRGSRTRRRLIGVPQFERAQLPT